MIPKIALLQPHQIVFGRGCAGECISYLRDSGAQRVFIVTGPRTRHLAAAIIEQIQREALEAAVYDQIQREPTVGDFEAALHAARQTQPDLVMGIGGGSVLDVAKLVAASLDEHRPIQELFGLDTLNRRHTKLICLPTTAGTGSEVSPNALLFDESAKSKKAVISSYLIPDASFVDPLLTVSLPASVTAATGFDALTHCMEAYTNRFAHPIVDLYALEGIRLIADSLHRAVVDGANEEARERVSLGSLYGGLCLGPVNTAAVHALAYPLSSEFHVPHGLSNAVLLPHVMQFNLSASPERYAQVARALGVRPEVTALETARRGVRKIYELMQKCGLPLSLSELNIPRAALPSLAEAAIQIQRLLKNNPREVTLSDVKQIYEAAFEPQAKCAELH